MPPLLLALLREMSHIIVYPMTGWWRSRPKAGQVEAKIRYALIVTLESADSTVDTSSFPVLSSTFCCCAAKVAASSRGDLRGGPSIAKVIKTSAMDGACSVDHSSNAHPLETLQNVFNLDGSKPVQNEHLTDPGD